AVYVNCMTERKNSKKQQAIYQMRCKQRLKSLWRNSISLILNQHHLYQLKIKILESSNSYYKLRQLKKKSLKRPLRKKKRKKEYGIDSWIFLGKLRATPRTKCEVWKLSLNRKNYLAKGCFCF